MESSRLFLACDVGDAITARMEKIVGQLAPHLPRVRWVPRDAMHITVKFFGELPWDRIRDIDAAVRSADPASYRCTFRVEGVGMFPTQSRPRVIWIGVGEGSDSLVRLAAGIESACREEGFKQERRGFIPHVTLGRFRGREQLSPRCREEIETRYGNVYCGTAMPDELVLYSSEVTSRGPVYTRMASWPLG